MLLDCFTFVPLVVTWSRLLGHLAGEGFTWSCHLVLLITREGDKCVVRAV